MDKMKFLLRLLALTTLLGIVLGSPGAQAQWTFTKVADNNTLIPDGSGNFLSYQIVVFDDGDVAFRGGSGLPKQQGVYTIIDGTLDVVADLNTFIPGGSGAFTRFRGLSFSSGEVAFLADNFGSGLPLQIGIYSTIGGMLDVIADRNTPTPPGGVFNFSGFGEVPSIDGGEVVFSGFRRNVFEPGIYSTIGGTLGVVADFTTAIPGGSGNFTSLFQPSISDGDVVFRGFGGAQQGIYSTVGGTLGVVADKTTPIPGGMGNFIISSVPVLDGGAVVFIAQGVGGQQGIYSTVGGTLDVVADINTAIPGGSGNFASFFSPSLSDGAVAFQARDASNQDGIYFARGGGLEKVIDETDTLEAKTLNSFGPQELSGDQLAFVAFFDDATSAIFIGTRTSDPADLIAALIEEVMSLNFQMGVENSLDAKLDNVRKVLEDLNTNNDVAAVNGLTAFINEVEAQRGEKIPVEQADALIADAQAIIDLLSAG